MTDYSELKRLAEAAKRDQNDYAALNDYGMAMPPAVTLALIAENERLRKESEALRSVANELRRFATCEDVHHDKPDWHEYGEPCKVLARIDAVLRQGEKPGD